MGALSTSGKNIRARHINEISRIPCFFPAHQGIHPETGSPETDPTTIHPEGAETPFRQSVRTPEIGEFRAKFRPVPLD